MVESVIARVVDPPLTAHCSLFSPNDVKALFLWLLTQEDIRSSRSATTHCRAREGDNPPPMHCPEYPFFEPALQYRLMS